MIFIVRSGIFAFCKVKHVNDQMLSETTLALLKELQLKSHAAYSEGGLLYTYTEASNQAHFRLPEIMPNTRSGQLAASEGHELVRFIQASQGDYASQSVDLVCVATSRELLHQLESDLNFDEIEWAFEEGGHDMNCALKMARRSDNCYFSLELMWSID